MEQRRPTPLDNLPLPPPVTLTLEGRQVQLLRLALESLLWGVRRDAHLTAEIRALLVQLPVTIIPAVPTTPPPTANLGAVAPPASTQQPSPTPARLPRVVD